MNRRSLILIAALIVVVVGAAILTGCSTTETRTAQNPPAARPPVSPPPPAKDSLATPSHSSRTPANGPRIPAHFETPPSASSLGPTLNPEQFTGPTRAAYQAVKEIPQTIAQLPCYCHCDEGFGHKSLHSCFEDEHGAHCAVCVNEVLMAYRMEKELKLTPAQIRERIVAYYSAQE